MAKSISKSKRPTNTEIRKKVTEVMIKALEGGVPPWRQPWGEGMASLPRNFHSHRRYTGINPVLLMFSAAMNGYTSPFWGTGVSWIKHTGCVLKARQKPTYVVLFTLAPMRDEDTGVIKRNNKGQPVLFPLMREFPLFNAEQVKAVPKKYLCNVEVRNNDPDFAPAERLIVASKADIRYGGARACYTYGEDFIRVPEKSSFDSVADFYETVFHELCHRGQYHLAKSKEDKAKVQNANQYAFNELVAEIGACMVHLELGVPMADQMLTKSASYVKAWVAHMGSDPKFIFDAATQAGKIVDYLFSFTKKKKKAKRAA